MTANPRTPTGLVLVVDDDPDTRELLQLQLGHLGYEVQQCGDGEQALAALAARSFDVVITDVRMAGMTGVELLRRIRGQRFDCEVIVVTAYADLETAIECIRAGALDLVQKPLQLPRLYGSVARAVERRRVREVGVLYAASQAVFTEPDPSRLPERIVDMARDAMPADYVSLLMPDEHGELYLAHSNGIAPAEHARTRVPLGQRVVGRVAANGVPVVITDRLRDDPRFSGVESMRPVRSSIVYPLKSGTRLVGVLTFNRASTDRSFQQRDVERASILAAQIVLALENTRLVRELVSSERLAAVGQLASGIAHEIGNPAAYITSNLAVLKNGIEGLGELADLAASGSADAVRAWLDRAGGREGLRGLSQAVADASEGAERIAAIVRDVRTLSRADDGRVGPFDANEVVRSAMRIAGADLRRRASVTTTLDANTGAMGAAARITQVLVNLVLVALRTTADHTELSFATRCEGERVLVEVAASGPELSGEAVTRMFDPTFSLDPHERGTGLGLAVSRDLVRAGGGELVAGARAGGGLLFTLSLPRET